MVTTSEPSQTSKPSEPPPQPQPAPPPAIPTLEEVTASTFIVGGDLESAYILGSNLKVAGLRVAVLKADKNEIPYADDPKEKQDPNYEVYLTDPTFDEVLDGSFPFSLEVAEAPVADDYKLVLTEKPRSAKVDPADANLYGDLTIKFEK